MASLLLLGLLEVTDTKIASAHISKDVSVTVLLVAYPFSQSLPSILVCFDYLKAVKYWVMISLGCAAGLPEAFSCQQHLTRLTQDGLIRPQACG